MPRAPRIEFAGAFYHVMSRGNHLELIVRDETDRQIWLKTLGEVCGDADTGAACRHAFIGLANR